jgi:antitoxin MazE
MNLALYSRQSDCAARQLTSAAGSVCSAISGGRVRAAWWGCSSSSATCKRWSASSDPSIFCVPPLCLQRVKSEQVVEVAIRKMGNSQGVLIPKPILTQIGLGGTADLQIRNGVIEIRAVRRNPREGWADDARRLAEQGGDALVWPEVANEGDSELVW